MDQIQTIGAIALWSEATPPQDWVFCDGSMMHVDADRPLLVYLGNKFGGDGVTTFALPKLGNVGNKRYIICKMGDFPRS